MVKLFDKEVSLIKLQVAAWLLMSALTFASYLQNADPDYAIVFTIINMISLLIVVYGNSFFLLPKLYLRGHRIAYVLATILLLGTICYLRAQLRYFFHDFYGRGYDPSSPFNVYFSLAISTTISYAFSFIFKLALDYFKLQKDQKRLKEYTSKVELDLLKAQVQPHFLFNTLNNIYYVAQRESTHTAALIEKLANIMRYFVDEASMNRVKLQTDVQFLEDYIELERMRMLYPMQVDIEVTGEHHHVEIPPMLITPLVENVIKHGIDKRSKDNYLKLSIHVEQEKIKIKIANHLFESTEKTVGGNGIPNLLARLDLLFGKNYRFEKKITKNTFLADLEIPL